MQKTLTCLIQLQQVDSQIHEIVKVRDTYPARVREIQGKIERQEQLYTSRKSELDELNEERVVKEKLLQGEEDKLRKWERRLKESTNPREAAPLAREIDAQKRLNSEAQEEVLRLMQEEERLGKELEEIEGHLSDLREKHAAEDAICKEKTSTFDEQLQTFETDREQYTKQLRSSILRKYEMIKKRRDGLAVVPARNGCCTGCNMKLRPQLYNIILKAQSFETCPSCQRILYSEEGLENGTP